MVKVMVNLTIEGVDYSLVADGPFRLVLHVGGTNSGIQIDFAQMPTESQQLEFIRQAHSNLSVA